MQIKFEKKFLLLKLAEILCLFLTLIELVKQQVKEFRLWVISII